MWTPASARAAAEGSEVAHGGVGVLLMLLDSGTTAERRERPDSHLPAGEILTRLPLVNPSNYKPASAMHHLVRVL